MRDFQRQRLYDFERIHLFKKSDPVFESLRCVQAFTDVLWTRLDLDREMRPTIKWLQARSSSAGQFTFRRSTDQTFVKFNRFSPLTMSIVLHELAHAIQYAKLGDDGPTNHDEMFCRVYFELQAVLNNEDLDHLIAASRRDGLEIWAFTTLKWTMSRTLQEKE